jgi:predicted GIY-YIG superfamily endonuclease
MVGSRFRCSRNDGTKSIFVFVDLMKVSAGVKRKYDPAVVRAQMFFETSGNLVMAVPSIGKALIELQSDGESAVIYDQDGAVYQLYRAEGKVSVQSLTLLEQAKKRIHLAVNQISRHYEAQNLKGVHGTLGGIFRLLSFVIRHDLQAAEVFIDYLVGCVGNDLPTGVRQDVERLLRAHHHPASIMFIDGVENTNVVVMSSHKSTDGAKARAEAERKRRERSQRDQEERAKMRGASGGGGGNSTPKQKKGGKK